MKKFASAALAVLLAGSMLAGCGSAPASTSAGSAAGSAATAAGSAAEAGSSAAITAPAEDVAMNYISVDDAKAKLDDADYVFFDVRKAEDYATSHIPGALSYDMDAAKEGDFEAGVATMSQATQDLDKNIVVICYSGKKYAQAATNTLSALGYDMSKVYTLEGGFKAWTEGGNDVEASEEVAAPAEDVAMNYISPEDTKAKLDDDTYTIIDQHKKADYDAGHIPGAISADLDGVVSGGDFSSGIVPMQLAKRLDGDNIILVCYSGKRYAQAGTNILSVTGYDMSKVYTLAGGFKAWSAAYPDDVEA